MSTSGVSGTDGLLAEQLINSSGGLTSGSTLTNSGAGGTLQITGLASGINTTELIQAELAQQEEPLVNMEDEVTALNTENSSLSTIQGALQTVSDDALLLGEPSTFFPVQNITSSNSDLVTAATTSGPGAAIGSTSITVTALASAAESTFNYSPVSTTDTGTSNLQITVGTNATSPASPTVYNLSIANDATTQDVADAINGNGNVGVWATVNTAGQLVLSSQTTGTGNEISAQFTSSSDGSSPTLSSSSVDDGTDAVINVLNTSAGTYSTIDSPTDSATDVIPGVTLTLTGITGTTATDNPVTITSAAPAPDTSAIITQVQQFVSDYNTVLNGIEADINTAPASESTPSDYSPYSGSLFGDDQLESLVGDMRTSLYEDYSVNSGDTGLTSLQDIGLSTGAPTSTASQSTVSGDLTLDTSQLTAAIASNPSGVEALITSWSQSFQSIVNGAASPTGSIAARITGNNTTITSLNGQVTSQEAVYDQEEESMEAQWAQVETTLEDLDNQKTSLSSFSDSLTSSTSSSSSS